MFNRRHEFDGKTPQNSHYIFASEYAVTDGGGWGNLIGELAGGGASASVLWVGGNGGWHHVCSRDGVPMPACQPTPLPVLAPACPQPTALPYPAWPTCPGAVSEAAFMTGMERNSDIVLLGAYAPLFVHWNNRPWPTNMVSDSPRLGRGSRVGCGAEHPQVPPLSGSRLQFI